MLSFEDIEDCFPDGALNDEATGKTMVSAQWLHDFARAVAAKEGEACAVIAENFSTRDGYEIAHKIRMRSNK